MEKTALKFLSVGQIRTNPIRPRQTISQQLLLELADSIRKYGIISPLLVNEQSGAFQLLCGERRLRAAKLAGLEEVPCLIVTINPKEAGLLSLAENLQREPLNLVDQAHLIQKLHKDHDFTLIEIGESTGLPIEQVEQLLSVIQLPDKIRRSYLQKDITEKQLLRLAEITDPVTQDTKYKELLS